MVRISENLNTSIWTELALQGAKFVEWLSDQIAALCELASRVIWKGSAEPAPSLETRVQLLPKPTANEREQIEAMIEVLKEALEDNEKLLQFVGMRNKLPKHIKVPYLAEVERFTDECMRATIKIGISQRINHSLKYFQNLLEEKN